MARKRNNSSDIPEEITIKVPEGQTTADVELPHISYETETEHHSDGVDVVVKRKVEWKNTKVNLPTKGKKPDEGQGRAAGQANPTGRGKRAKQVEKARKQKEQQGTLPKKRYSKKEASKEVDRLGWSGINKLDTADLRKLVSPYRDALNKNMKAIKKKGLEKYSPAYQSRKGKLFSTKGKDRNGLLKELRECIEYDNKKTSNPSKIKKSLDSLANKLGLKKDMKDFIPDAMKMWGEVKENEGYFAELLGYKGYVNKAVNMLAEGKSPRAVKGAMTRAIRADISRGTSTSPFRTRGVK